MYKAIKSFFHGRMYYARDEVQPSEVGEHAIKQLIRKGLIVARPVIKKKKKK